MIDAVMTDGVGSEPARLLQSDACCGKNKQGEKETAAIDCMLQREDRVRRRK